jgi:hypothetical protein
VKLTVLRSVLNSLERTQLSILPDNWLNNKYLFMLHFPAAEKVTKKAAAVPATPKMTFSHCLASLNSLKTSYLFLTQMIIFVLCP